VLLSISLTNFKSYQDAALPLAPLSLLIGANASGKSNAIEGIRFLSWLAEGRRMDDLMSAVQSEDQRLRGTIKNLAYEGMDTFGFRCKSVFINPGARVSGGKKIKGRKRHITKSTHGTAKR
jgi:AAA15 family ATPase/GTPase